MKWFLAKLVYQVVCGKRAPSTQFDEQVRLIYAEDELHAFYKGRLLGENETTNQEIENLVNVQWKFIDITELHAITNYTDGAEIFSAIREEADAALYIRMVQKTAMQLLQRGLQQFNPVNNSIIETSFSS